MNGNVIEAHLPDSISIIEKQYGRSLQSNKMIKKGDIVYTAHYYLIPNDEQQ
jgi:hypothetical protein